jgi:hypothetical protein
MRAVTDSGYLCYLAERSYSWNGRLAMDEMTARFLKSM